MVGIANDQSIAYGCAKAFRELGAELAITFLNDKAKPYVAPLADELEAPIFMPMDAAKSGEVEAVFEPDDARHARATAGYRRFSDAYDRLRGWFA